MIVFLPVNTITKRSLTELCYTIIILLEAGLQFVNPQQIAVKADG
jgi:hypothetical protein